MVEIGDYVRVKYPGRSYHGETGYILGIDPSDDDTPYAVVFDNYHTDFEWTPEVEIIAKKKVKHITGLPIGTKVKMPHTTYDHDANETFTVESYDGEFDIDNCDPSYTLLDDDGDEVYAFFVIPLNSASARIAKGVQSKSRLIVKQQTAVR